MRAKNNTWPNNKEAILRVFEFEYGQEVPVRPILPHYKLDKIDK